MDCAGATHESRLPLRRRLDPTPVEPVRIIFRRDIEPPNAEPDRAEIATGDGCIVQLPAGAGRSRRAPLAFAHI